MNFVKSIFNFLRFNKKNWKAVVLCIFAATVFWFFNALNKNYSTNINFALAFEYDQDRFIPMTSLPSTVRMNVTGSGWDLFRRSLGFKVPPLVIPLERPAEVSKIVGTTLPAIFAGQLERLTINFIITDTVRIQLEEKTRKKFNVKIDSVQQYIDSDFGLVNEPRVNPDTVWLEGPHSVISELPETLILSLPQTDIRRNFNEDIELQLEQRNLITRDPQKINVSFDVEKFVQVEKRIRLTIINIPSRLKQNSVRKEVSCTYRLPASTSETFVSDSLEAVVDLKYKPNGTHKLVPKVMGLPSNAIVVKTDTVVINF